MHKVTAGLLLTLVVLAQGLQHANSMGRISEEKFVLLMNTVADGWNERNALKAADCFAS